MTQSNPAQAPVVAAIHPPSVLRAVLITAISMLLGMSAFEELPRRLLPVVTREHAAGLTILVSTLVAAFVAALVARRHHTMQREREVAQTALQRSKEQLAEAQVLAHVGSWTADIATGTEAWSEELYRIYGLEPYSQPSSIEAFIGLVHPEDRAEVGIAIKHSSQRVGTYSLEYRIVRPDGAVRIIIDQARVLVDAGGTPSWIVGASQDITERKHAEQGLAEREQRYRQMFEGNRSVQWLINPISGAIVEVNPAASAFYGYSVNDLQHMNITDINISLDLHAFREVAQGLSQVAGDLTFRHKLASGEVRDVEVHTGPVDVGGHRLLYSIIHDVTAQQQTAAAQQARILAEQANHAKSEFLSRMSHELRTPLNAILGFAQLLEMEGLEPLQQESIDQILKGGRHLLMLINEVLDIAGIESGRLSMSPELVNLGEILEEAIALIEPIAAPYGVTVRDDRDLGCQHSVLADKQRLKQVLLNLLSNAIKYNRPGGSVHVSCTAAADDRLRLDVRDTGAGIPELLMPRLFMPFDRLDAEQTSIEGTGLGLALSKRLMEGMGGSIGVESVVGVGSTFWVELPVGEASVDGCDAPPVAERSFSDPLPPVQPAHKLLYIEDNLANFRLIERVLSRRPGITLLPALQGRLGLDLANEHQPDLILLDVHLPDVSGEEVLRQLRANPVTCATPVIMLSADANPRRCEQLLSAGANAYLTKPLDVAQFLALVDDTINALNPA